MLLGCLRLTEMSYVVNSRVGEKMKRPVQEMTFASRIHRFHPLLLFSALFTLHTWAGRQIKLQCCGATERSTLVINILFYFFSPSQLTEEVMQGVKSAGLWRHFWGVCVCVLTLLYSQYQPLAKVGTAIVSWQVDRNKRVQSWRYPYLHLFICFRSFVKS